MKTVGPGTKITLHFTLSLETGEVVDSTREKAPATLMYGDGNLPAGFEKALEGMQQGQRQVHRILPEQAFGMPNPNNLQEFPLSQFDGMELTPGLVLGFQDAAKSEVPGIVVAIEDDQVQVDFNHPLAGKTLLFDAEIIALELV